MVDVCIFSSSLPSIICSRRKDEFPILCSIGEAAKHVTTQRLPRAPDVKHVVWGIRIATDHLQKSMCKLECNILRARGQKECRFCDDSPIE